ncbi:MFS transporter [candidate division KSB1 bacterium]|nr:MFS transporter [candidate division KSB1 bacterium]
MTYPAADQNREKKITLLIVTLTSFLTPFMAAGANIALPRIGAELNLHAILLTWIASAYILSAAVFLLPFGRLADIHGRKKIFTWGIVFFGFGSLLVALAHNASVLIAARVVQGLGGGMVFGTGTAMLTSAYPPGERGRALGWNIGAVYLGLSVGPPAGGALVGLIGWRSIFWINVASCLLILTLIFFYLKGDHREAAHESFDFIGAILYGCGITGLMIGFSTLPGFCGYLALFLGLIVLFLFYKWERRTSMPLLHFGLLMTNRVFAFSSLAAFINYSSTFAVGFLLSLYLQTVKGFSPQQAGFLLVPQPIVQAVFAPLSGHLSDRIEPQKLASIGMACSAAGLMMLILLNQNTGLYFFILSLIFLGLGFGLFSSPNTNAIMSSVQRRQFGVASATVGTMRLLGQMFSMGVATLIITLWVGDKSIITGSQPQFVTAMHIIFAIFAALSFFGIFASMARGKMRERL